MGKDKVKGGGQTLGGFFRATGIRNKCYKCESGYHLAPKCPLRYVPRSEFAPRSPVNRKARRPPYSVIPMEAPAPE